MTRREPASSDSDDTGDDGHGKQQGSRAEDVLTDALSYLEPSSLTAATRRPTIFVLAPVTERLRG
jgi:hypothetical protein